jgi:hypothetical protein
VKGAPSGEPHPGALVVAAKPIARPTRRMFVTLIGAAAAALATRGGLFRDPGEPPQRPWNGKTRWIGHC